jgi:hypothetical protein
MAMLSATQISIHKRVMDMVDIKCDRFGAGFARFEKYAKTATSARL